MAASSTTSVNPRNYNVVLKNTVVGNYTLRTGSYSGFEKIMTYQTMYGPKTTPAEHWITIYQSDVIAGNWPDDLVKYEHVINAQVLNGSIT